MPPESPRRLSVSDAMILLAATAIGIAAIRGMWDDWRIFQGFYSGAPFLERGRIVLQWVVGAQPCLAAWTIALAVLRLRGPRARTRLAAREPGFVACASAGAALAVGGLLLLTETRIAGSSRITNLVVFLVLVSTPIYAGAAVAVAWLLLTLRGPRRSSPHLLDRAGRLLGGFWIAWGLVSLVLFAAAQ